MSQDFRGVPKPPPPAGSKQQLPFPPGAVIGKVSKTQTDAESKKLTDIERQVLEQAGWQPGDPIPDLTNLAVGQRLSAALQQLRSDAVNTEGMSPLPPGTPPIKPPTMRSLAELSPAERAEVQQAIAAAKQLAQQQPVSPVVPPEIAGVPGMEQAYRTAVQPELELVNDTVPRAQFNPQQQPPLQPPPQPAPQPPTPEPEVEPQEAPATPGMGSALPREPEVCRKCGHAIGTDVVEPTTEDKQAFVQTLLGGQRFRKTYTLFDDKIKLVFRSLTPRESELALSQLDHAANDGQLVSHAQYFRTLTEYRLAMSLESFQRAGSAPITLGEPLQLEFDSENHVTILPQLLDYVNDTLFVTDHVRRAVGAKWLHFQGLVEHMEARADDADFWKAIGDAA